jgi:hypothetical protein
LPSESTSVAYSEKAPVALVIQYAKRMRRIVLSSVVCLAVAYVIQHTKRVRRIVLSSVVCLAVPYFLTSSHKRRDFRKKETFLRIKMFFDLL